MCIGYINQEGTRFFNLPNVYFLLLVAQSENVRSVLDFLIHSAGSRFHELVL